MKITVKLFFSMKHLQMFFLPHSMINFNISLQVQSILFISLWLCALNNIFHQNRLAYTCRKTKKFERFVRLLHETIIKYFYILIWLLWHLFFVPFSRQNNTFLMPNLNTHVLAAFFCFLSNIIRFWKLRLLAYFRQKNLHEK